MHGGDKVAEVLVRQGVTALFTLCGGHISPILSGARSRGIEVVDTRHEANAVFAADAWARLSGRPGVAAVTAGPGVTNAVTALKNAQLAQSPLVLLGGASATVLRGRGSLQDIDQLSLMRPTTKWAVSVERVADIVPVLNEAFAVAQEGVPGPVFVELPIDILYPERIVREWYGAKGGEQAQGVMGRAVQWYLDHHTRQLFEAENGTTTRARARQAVRQVRGALETGLDQFQLETLGRLVAGALRKARRPVMVLGSQVALSPGRIPALVGALETLGVPVYLSGMARGLLGAHHALQYRHQRRQALREADLVLLAGVPCDFRLDYGAHIRRSATLVSVNRSLHDLKLNRIPDIPVWADPAGFLVQLAGLTGPLETDRAWRATLDERELARERWIDDKAAAPGEQVNPVRLFRELDKLLDDRAVLVADGGDFVATAAYTLRPRSPLSWLDPGVFGTLGVGGGFALGARAVRPDSEIWIIYGDGSSAYSLAEMDTFRRKGWPVIALIGNDACWNQIYRDQVVVLEDDVAVTLRQSDYHKVGEGYGARGLVIRNNDEIVSKLGRARTLARQGHPVVVNVLLERSDFREGSISV
ncbi:thiamine pyrophosphate-binding protein [Hahella sp. SMD15-11]|uniref:Thiamine pyrophosphate-binding protein n=1 Tax=Thermohahella caldifontis TaxID=3142973 RepID=A0AB39UW21_9GAMM